MSSPSTSFSFVEENFDSAVQCFDQDNESKSSTRNTNSRDRRISSVLDDFKAHMEERTQNHFGYPYNLDFMYAPLVDLMKYSINNLGDPFVESNYGIQSRQFEIEVLDFFAKLFHIEPDQYWGYVNSCGTEGNLHGVLVGRECFPTGILYCSKDSHYSVLKAARFFRMQAIVVESQKNGEIDYDDLEAKLVANKHVPAILNLNVGTTVKGAIDDIDRVIEILERNDIKEHYIHCDGALSGMMLPFIDNAMEISFKKKIDSVSVSGHKFIGAPFPCGIIIHRKSNILKVQQDIEYIGSKDTTIGGSRNGHAPLYMWLSIRKKQRCGFKADVEACLKNAQLLAEELVNAGINGVLLNKWSNTVVFEKPKDVAFCKKYQLATCKDITGTGEIAHVITMPNITPENIHNFVAELIESNRQFEAAIAAAAAADGSALLLN